MLNSSVHYSPGGRANFLIGQSNANLMNLAVELHRACTLLNIHDYESARILSKDTQAFFLCVTTGVQHSVNHKAQTQKVIL